LPKVAKIPAITPKRRRMANVLDTILESTRVPTTASSQVPSMGKKNMEATKAVTTRAEAEVGPSAPAEIGHVETEQGSSDATLNLEKEGAPKIVKTPALEGARFYYTACFGATVVGRADCRSQAIC
jgi:hypothetical protein